MIRPRCHTPESRIATSSISGRRIVSPCKVLFFLVGNYCLGTDRKESYLRLVVAAFCAILFSFHAICFGAEKKPSQNDTMLMFVGEDLDVLTIASRREESAWQAPAIADVITRKQMRAAGMWTVGEALSTLPGFYMAKKEWGATPYLRGIPNSTLFQMDTVPLGSDVTKSLNFLDGEISLAGIKRIEVVRGPGSVLWGPDAFAGIVNLVPMTGKDLKGVETGLRYGDPGDRVGAFANVGYDNGTWDVFGSFTGQSERKDDRTINVVRFWENDTTPYPADERLGATSPGHTEDKEAYLRVGYENWLSLSGRVSQYRRPYALLGDDGQFTWGEERSMTSGYVKFEAHKTLGISSALRFMGSYTWLSPEQLIIDKTISQREETAYGEMIYDLSMFSGAGLMTAGISYREKHITGAPVWDGYLYDFLSLDNDLFVPGLTLENYNTYLWSCFGQYLFKMGPVNLVAGLRYDNHNPYQDNTSFNFGAVWTPNKAWVVKLLYDSAYRTPFARQLRSDDSPQLEKIKTISGQVAWKGTSGFGLSLCLFNNQIDNHVMEDPYAGLSEPNHQEINGIEFELSALPRRDLEVKANFTLMDNSGPKETYRFNDYSFIRPDGSVEKHYIDLFYDYDSGPKRLLNLMATWKPKDWVTVYGRLSYASGTSLIYPRNESPKNFSGVWLLNGAVSFHVLPKHQLDVEVSVKNALDDGYEVPGTYNQLNGDPFTAQVEVRTRW
jgi:outer membrane cobalamin receptor